MQQEYKPMTWIVKNFDQNAQKLIDYDVLKYRENDIKKLKKKCATKEEFAEALRIEFMWQYWSRAEYELVIEIDENNHIWLNAKIKKFALIKIYFDRQSRNSRFS